jgi:hypothetical protein
VWPETVHRFHTTTFLHRNQLRSPLAAGPTSEVAWFQVSFFVWVWGRTSEQARSNWEDVYAIRRQALSDSADGRQWSKDGAIDADSWSYLARDADAIRECPDSLKVAKKEGAGVTLGCTLSFAATPYRNTRSLQDLKLTGMAAFDAADDQTCKPLKVLDLVPDYSLRFAVYVRVNVDLCYSVSFRSPAGPQ